MARTSLFYSCSKTTDFALIALPASPRCRHLQRLATSCGDPAAPSEAAPTTDLWRGPITNTSQCVCIPICRRLHSHFLRRPRRTPQRSAVRSPQLDVCLCDPLLLPAWRGAGGQRQPPLSGGRHVERSPTVLHW